MPDSGTELASYSCIWVSQGRLIPLFQAKGAVMKRNLFRIGIFGTVLCLVFATTVSESHASETREPADQTTTSETGDTAEKTTTDDAVNPYSPSKALQLSLIPTASTLVIGGGIIWAGFAPDWGQRVPILWGYGIAIVGTAVGPSAGHFYADNRRHAISTLLIRSALGLGGFVANFGAVFCDMYCPEKTSALWAGTVTLYTGALALAIYSIATAPRSARRANIRQEKATWNISPTQFKLVGSNAYGLVFSKSF